MIRHYLGNKLSTTLCSFASLYRFEMSFLHATALLSRQQAPLARASQRALSSVSKMTIVGTVGNDPETRSFDNGGSQVSFAVATHDFVAGEEVTMWHKVTLSSVQKISNYVMDRVRKGDQVYVEGTLKMRKYMNKEGVEVDRHRIQAFEVSRMNVRKDASETETLKNLQVPQTQMTPVKYSNSPPQKRKYANFAEY